MKYEAFLPHVLPSVKGCPDGLAIDHVIKAARRFCSRTLAWNYETPTIKSVADIADYTLQIPDDQELVRALLVEVDGREYSVPSGMRGRQLSRQSASSVATFSAGGHDFTLTPAPHLPDLAIIVDVAVRPALPSSAAETNAAVWPDDLAEHVEDIAGGALATLLKVGKHQPWYDPAGSVDRENTFVARMGAVAMKVAKGYGHTRQGARVAWF